MRHDKRYRDHPHRLAARNAAAGIPRRSARRVPLRRDSAGPNCVHPIRCGETGAPGARGILFRDPPQLFDPAGSGGDAVSTRGMGGAAEHPLRRSPHLRRSRQHDRQPTGNARRRRRLPRQPGLHHHSVPPRGRGERDGRLRRGVGNQAEAPRHRDRRQPPIRHGLVTQGRVQSLKRREIPAATASTATALTQG